MPAVETKTGFTLKEILFATDFSSGSAAASPYAAALARRFGGRLHLAHVAPGAPALMVPAADYIPAYPREAPSQADVLHETERKLFALAHSPQFAGLRSETVVGEGKTAAEIVRIAGDRDVDLVILGTHGYTGLDRLLLGSVAEQLLRTLPCPVLTVGSKVWIKPEEAIQIRRLLVATDSGNDTERFARYVFSLARALGAQLILLHAVALDEKAFSFDRVMAEEAARQRLLEAFPECGTELWCKPIVAFGEPTENILEVAHRERADLIVMGARRAPFPGVSAHLGGSTAHQVLLEATCPVLTVRH